MSMINLSAKKFGKLTVIKLAGHTNRGYSWLCKCDCGNEIVAIGVDLRQGHKTSCGCMRWKGDGKRTHGMSSTRPHRIHSNMKKRCNNPKCPDFPNYGGRGIKYDPKWETFSGFWEDMKEGYADNLTLDRIDNNKGYCKENCRWVSRIIQANNTRHNHYIFYHGEKYTLSQLSKKMHFNYDLVRERLGWGWSLEEALQRPLKQLETIEINGETKTVVEAAKDKGMTYHQLKKRLMRGWTIERALNQPLRKRPTQLDNEALRQSHAKHVS